VPIPTWAQGFLGRWAVRLAVLSNALFNFGGGEPGSRSTAGTREPWQTPLGSAASDGCIRIDNDEIDCVAAQVQPRLPVDITD
jgi:hypothetical protein